MRRLVTMARYGLGVMHAPVPAVIAALLQCLGWTVPALRGLGSDARVRHPRAAAGRRARARADERGDALPALARQRRARPGRGRAAARLLRRRLRRRASRSGSGCRRSRCRSASGSGSSSSPARGSRSRCSSACPGAEQAEVAPARRTRRRARRGAGRVRALASPASCKGVLSAVEAALALAAGMRARRPRGGGAAGRRRRRRDGRGLRGHARRRVADGAGL